MYILFLFVTKFFQYNNLYKLFLFLFYWYSTKYCKTSCFQIYLPCLVISQLINSTLNESLIIYLRYKFSECLLTTLLAAFLVVCSILQWKMSQSDCFSARPHDKFFYAKPTATFDWMSFWYSGDMYVLTSLTTWKHIKEYCWKKQFSHVIKVLRDPS